ncbi:MAG: BREX-2 system adenine-specific DNA-methyltransferase PglX, partial [Burkholderiales bacterium]
MIDAKRLLADLQGQQRALENDLREQVRAVAGLREVLEADYRNAREANRTGDTLNVWSENEITQAAVAWLLACVFVRFCEDNRLIAAPLLAGPGDGNRRAREAAREYFQQHPTDNDRHWLLHAFDQMARYPAVAGLYRKDHNPLYRLPISADAATALLSFWQAVDPDSGALIRDFTDSELDTRFLGDLYQDLSESARKRFALLQTPIFVEEFILDRTLDPAIETFGLEHVRMIDPTCGSGHFLLGAFARINALWERQGLEPRERVKRTLASVYGVDLNPFAVAIARFRLLVVALKATGIGKLKEAPGWQFNVTTGDSLLHGRRFGELDLGSDDLDTRFAHCFFAEDRAEIDRILGQQYHAVVGNPPYITVKD